MTDKLDLAALRALEQAAPDVERMQQLFVRYMRAQFGTEGQRPIARIPATTDDDDLVLSAVFDLAQAARNALPMLLDAAERAARYAEAINNPEHIRLMGRPNPHLEQAYRCRLCDGTWWERETDSHKPWCPIAALQQPDLEDALSELRDEVGKGT